MNFGEVYLALRCLATLPFVTRHLMLEGMRWIPHALIQIAILGFVPSVVWDVFCHVCSGC
jgi:hypothetical protein